METDFIALLGSREKPTDGVEDYCHYLADALSKQGITMKTERVDWENLGWVAALRKLRRQSADWRGARVVLHYTALSWSRRGFPLGALSVLHILRRRGLRCAVLFHEPTRQSSGTRVWDSLRGTFQDWVIRRLFRSSNNAIFTVPLDAINWLQDRSSKACYIPIGANVPERISRRTSEGRNGRNPSIIAVFCLSLGENRFLEIADMAFAAERLRRSHETVRFVVFGKGSTEARGAIEAALHDKGAEVSVLGKLPAEEIADSLADADVLLYLTGWVSQNRGSALAGVACGLPIVGYAGASREPIHEAGVELVPYRDREALAEALVRVLNDPALRSELRRKSVDVQQRHFSWDSIAGRYATEFGLGERALPKAPALTV